MPKFAIGAKVSYKYKSEPSIPFGSTGLVKETGHFLPDSIKVDFGEKIGIWTVSACELKLLSSDELAKVKAFIEKQDSLCSGEKAYKDLVRFINKGA